MLKYLFVQRVPEMFRPEEFANILLKANEVGDDKF